MSAKISNLRELYPIVSDEEKISEGVLGIIERFDLKRLLKPLSGFKTKGINLMTVLSALILCRFRGLSVYSMYKSGQTHIDENTLYRMMNHPGMDWRSALLGLYMQFLRITGQKGEENKSVRCFIIDDTVITKTGSTIEGISNVFDHSDNSYSLGFKMLTLTLWEGKSSLPLDFSLHRESKKKNYGLSDREIKNQFAKQREKNSYGSERYNELDIEKNTVALQMLGRVNKHHIDADYVLMDSWFVNDIMIKGIRKIRSGKMHVIGMCKTDRKFLIDGRELKSDAIIKLKGLCKGNKIKSRKYKLEYIKVDAIYRDTPVRLFFIKYKRAKYWKLLLTTDLSLLFNKVMELYQIRWTIEVFFKECKQYLRLGQAQNTDFDGQIADAAITLMTHVMLSLQLRFQAYETMGGLFRGVQNQIVQDTLHKRIMQTILEIIEKLLEILSIDVEETISMIMNSDETNEQVINLLMSINKRCSDGMESRDVA